MNKQELIERIEGLKNLFGNKAEYIEIDAVIELVSKLDEPEKVKVLPFVADWYEDVVDEFYIVLERLVLNYRNNTNMPICKWFFETEDALKILINMHQFGYEVEKERRYIVTLKSSGQKLYYHTEDEDYIFSSYDGVFYSEYHTKTDLEENNMSWVFDCPGIEIEEVE